MPFRETLVLRDVQGLDYREIAEVTKVPIGTVMSRLARARRRLMRAYRNGRGKRRVMTASTNDPRLLVHAYVDGELDPANALELEQQLANDPSAGGRTRADRGAAARHRRAAAARGGAARARAPDRSGGRRAHGAGADSLTSVVARARGLGRGGSVPRQRRDLACAFPRPCAMPTWSWPITCAR